MYVHHSSSQHNVIMVAIVDFFNRSKTSFIPFLAGGTSHITIIVWRFPVGVPPKSSVLTYVFPSQNQQFSGFLDPSSMETAI